MDIASETTRRDSGIARAARPSQPAFDVPVADSGYRWWYLDGLSEDGLYGLTLIAFIGSVFSPYYATARKRGAARAENHCAVNIALYSTRSADAGQPRVPSRWAMTERGGAALARSANHLKIGPSRLEWDGRTLTASIDEVTFPWPSRLRGAIWVDADALANRVVPLDAAGRHVWQPIAPYARLRVQLDSPRINWSGHAYLDSNGGDEPLEDAFKGWHWSRTHAQGPGPTGETLICYDVCRRDGTTKAVALRFDGRGGECGVAVPPEVDLPRTGWGIARTARSEQASAGDVRVLRTLEDTPFYARSLVATRWNGQPAEAMHESLSLQRFRARWVQSLLPFRMPRRPR